MTVANHHTLALPMRTRFLFIDINGFTVQSDGCRCIDRHASRNADGRRGRGGRGRGGTSLDGLGIMVLNPHPWAPQGFPS